MTLGYTDGKTKIKIGFLVTCILSICLLTLFELRKVITGPNIDLHCPTLDCDKIITEENIYTLSGTTTNISDIHVGNKKIYTDTKGSFKEQVLLYPGQNAITIYAKDRFGKEVKKDISVYYKGPQKETL